jgi:hypothetical protein
MRMRRPEHAACMKDIRMVYKILVGKRQGKKPLWIPRCRQQDIFKMNVKLLLTNTVSEMWSGSLPTQQHHVSKTFLKFGFIMYVTEDIKSRFSVTTLQQQGLPAI